MTRLDEAEPAAAPAEAAATGEVVAVEAVAGGDVRTYSPVFDRNCQDDCIPLYIVPAPAAAVRRTRLCCACRGRHAKKCLSDLPSVFAI